MLDPEEGFVIAEKSIDAQAYENFSYYVVTQDGERVYNGLDCKNLANNWATCSMRAWLNKDFYNTAFTAEEKAQIGKTYLDNDNPFSPSYDGAGTFDKIFLISYYDAINTNYGFNSAGDQSDSERIKEATDYAMCQGADVTTYTAGTYSYWWLRTTWLYGAKNFATSPGGWIVSDGGGAYNVNFTDMCVVPAFKFNPKTPALAKNSTVEFGSYPQSEVKDADEIAKLETASESYLWVSYKYYSGTGERADGKMQPDDFMLYKDFYFDGEKYRAVTFSEYRSSFSGGKKEKAYSFQDENHYYPNNVYYFKYEPLNWRVLDPDEGYVMCENAIDSQAYQNYIIEKDGSLYNSKDYTNYVSDWETCSLRQWLNNTFYNTAFSAEEKKLIGTTYLENNSSDGTWLGTDTADKIFILSYNDAVNSAYGFDSSNEANDEARKIKGTAYSNCQGLYINSEGIAWWWLRSPGDSERVDNVSNFGWASLASGVYGTGMGIVPAFKFNPKAVDIQLNFDLDGGEWAEGYTAPTSYKSNESLMLPTASDLSKQGYTFGGWEQTSLTNKTVSYKAKWIVNQYTITFSSNGGTAVDSITQDYGTAITAPSDPTRTGYTFAGWDKQIPSTMPAENMTITAKWNINKYTITFDSNGGTAVDPITQDYGTAITAPSDPTRTDYTFAGWDKAIPSTMPAENMTITAKWNINKYTITFDSNGGTAVDPITQDYGTAITAPSDPTRTGYTFAGWDKAIPATMPAENMTITAKWNINKYTITFDSNGGTAVDSITQDYGTAITAPSDPTRTGYTFAGWDKQIPSTMPAENMTITAKWNVNRYTITFDSNGGTAVDSITADYGTAIIAPSDPTRTGYTFAGWDKQIPTTMQAENMTITAQWILCDHSGNTNKTTCEHETVCSVCGGTVAADPHSFSQQWSYDASVHWHECLVCGIQIDNAEHTFEWVTDKEATETEKGEKHEECTVCHATRNEHTEIPATGKDNIFTRIYNWIVKMITKLIMWVVDFINTVC